MIVRPVVVEGNGTLGAAGMAKSLNESLKSWVVFLEGDSSFCLDPEGRKWPIEKLKLVGTFQTERGPTFEYEVT